MTQKNFFLIKNIINRFYPVDSQKSRIQKKLFQNPNTQTLTLTKKRCFILNTSTFFPLSLSFNFANVNFFHHKNIKQHKKNQIKNLNKKIKNKEIKILIY